jgi:hypothetical protein
VCAPAVAVMVVVVAAVVAAAVAGVVAVASEIAAIVVAIVPRRFDFGRCGDSAPGSVLGQHFGRCWQVCLPLLQ